MGFCRAVVSLNQDSLLPVDRSINVWHFITPAGVAAASADIATLLDAFYTAIGSRLSQSLTGTGDIDFYDLEDPSPRVPVDTIGITFTPGSTSNPSECAICLSFQGVTASGVNQARRRGRLYIGPTAETSGTFTLNDKRPSSACRTDIATAADAVKDQVLLSGLIWCVFSPTTAGSPPWSAGVLADAFVPVANGWVDDAYDTQRRRGLAATTRTVF